MQSAQNFSWKKSRIFSQLESASVPFSTSQSTDFRPLTSSKTFYIVSPQTQKKYNFSLQKTPQSEQQVPYNFKLSVGNKMVKYLMETVKTKCKRQHINRRNAKSQLTNHQESSLTKPSQKTSQYRGIQDDSPGFISKDSIQIKRTVLNRHPINVENKKIALLHKVKDLFTTQKNQKTEEKGRSRIKFTREIRKNDMAILNYNQFEEENHEDAYLKTRNRLSPKLSKNDTLQENSTISKYTISFVDNPLSKSPKNNQVKESEDEATNNEKSLLRGLYVTRIDLSKDSRSNIAPHNEEFSIFSSNNPLSIKNGHMPISFYKRPRSTKKQVIVNNIQDNQII